jgi:hypothetical protein
MPANQMPALTQFLTVENYEERQKSGRQLPTEVVTWGHAAKDRRGCPLIGEGIRVVPFQAARRSYRW